mgnify:CR=1 FL=1
MSWLLMILGLWVGQPQAPASPPAPASTLDYEFFRTRVQPIFLAKRPGHARCITCHQNGQPRLVALSPGASTWTDEQSRQNFAAWQRVVVPGDPGSSRLLTHPLAKAAGGDPFHAGGRHWDSKSDPEFQTLVAWVQTGAQAQTAAASGGELDFAVYRARIEPIFLKERGPNEGVGRCVNCHSRIATRLRLQPIADGATAWTEAQSRQNFDAVKRVVVPGDPARSPLAVHPLATAAGGDAQHTGGKFWASKDHPEYLAVEAWVKSAAPAAGAATTTPALDFEFFRARVQPIFLAKRPGHARCITCHQNGQPRLIALSPGASTWTEEQSRQNFTAWQRVVVPGEPASSRLLTHPLAKSAGGDPFHAGGRHWDSQSDPEFQTLVAWIRGEKASPSSR